MNASPDIRQQIIDNSMLHPQGAVRSSGIAAIALMDSQIDHVTGLLMMRESHQPLSIYCTERTEEDLRTGFPILEMLEHYCGVRISHLPLQGIAVEPPETPGVRVLPVPLTSKAPPYSDHREDPQPGDNLGLMIESPDTGKRAFYAPGLGEVDDSLRSWMAGADIIMVDGTTWTNDEMARVVGGSKTSREMGHLPLTGEGGMLDVLADYPNARRILVHINNTNPVLDPESSEREQLEALGIEVSYDGMDIRF